MKSKTTNQPSVLNSIRNSKGRFFGLYTNQGESLNAQFTNETDRYITIYDRNARQHRRLAKTSIAGVRLASTNVGVVF